MTLLGRGRLLLVAGAVLTAAAARLAASEPPGDPAKNGPVRWSFDAGQKAMPLAQLDHFRHASSKGLKIPCTRCHHTSKGVDVEAGCPECHGSAWSPEVPDIKSATHALCIRCHVQNNAAPAARPAPYKCAGCHRGAAPGK
jgi:predicted CXXCH cytochrome family protein